MPRQPRLDAPGVLQHVMARGIERRKIFWDDKDRTSFLERLALILEETQTQCYAWALIPNHFHILLRTGPSASADASGCRAGPTPPSKVMRRMMTGYAVTFNKRHKRSGYLFQNRYKSVICEEDPYLLELIRYIHLNPLRAKLVQDLKELDKYPWTGHSAILGHRKNPLVPAIKDPKSGIKNQAPSQPLDGKSTIRNPRSEILLADRTIQDVLLHFGKTKKVARRRYREFVEKGTAQGRRSEFQGGGLVRSAGGNKAGLLGRKKDEREKGDARILGSGDFVNTTLHQSEKLLEKKYRPKKAMDDLMTVVADKVGMAPELICSRSRQRKYSEARAIFSYLAVEETGYSAADVARYLGVKRMSVHEAVTKGKTLCADYASLG